METNEKTELHPKKRSFIIPFNGEVESDKIDKVGQFTYSSNLSKENLIQHAVHILKKPPQNRNTGDLTILQRCTQDIKFFREYTLKNQQQIHTNCCKSMKHLHLHPNETVFEIDTIGSAFYVILQGSVKVLIKVVKPNNETTLEDSKQEDNPSKMKSNKTQKEKLIKLQLRHCITSIAASPQPNLLKSAISRLQTPISQTHLQRNNHSSQILVDIDDKNDLESQLMEVNVLTKGDSFGELALLSNKPRAAMIICREECDFAVLEKRDFVKILKASEEKKLLEEMNFFASLNIFKNWNFNLVKMLYVNTQTRACGLNEIVYEEGQESEEMFIVQKGVFVIEKYFVSPNSQNVRKWGDLKELFSNESNYNTKKVVQLGVLNLNEVFGEEDMILNRKRAYTVHCQTAEGLLRIINRKNFFQRVMRDETTAKLLEEKTRNKEIWYKKEFHEITVLRKQVLSEYEDKNNIFGMTEAKMKQKPQETNYFKLKKPKIHLENSNINTISEINEEKIFDNLNHSYIFKKVLNYDAKNRKNKNIQQIRINTFLNRVPKPKPMLHYTFSNNFVKKLYHEPEFRPTESQNTLKISLSSPKLQKILNDKSNNKTTKILKKLYQSVNPNQSFEKKQKYFEIDKNFLLYSMRNYNQNIESTEKNNFFMNFSFEKFKDLKKMKNNSRDDETNRFIINTPKEKRGKNAEELFRITGREKELLGLTLKKHSKKNYNLI